MDNLQELLNKLQQLYAADDLKSMAELLPDKVLTEYSRAELYAWRAFVCNAVNDYSSAYKYAQEAIKANPTYKVGFLQRGLAFYNFGDWKSAVSDLNEVVESGGADANVYFYRATALFGLQKYDAAIEDYSEVIRLDENNVDAFYNRGSANLYLANYSEALEDFNQVISVKDKYCEAICNRGLVYFYLGDADNATKDYDHAININDHYVNAYYNKGLLAHQQGNYDEALKQYGKAIEIDDNFSAAFNNRGNIYLIREENDNCIKDLNRALALNPGFPEAYLNRGIIYKRQLHYDNAKMDFKDAIKLFQHDKNANEVYLNFLEEQLKLIAEIVADKKLLDSLDVDPGLKNAKLEIEKNIDLVIDRIAQAAKSDVKTVVHYTKLFVADIYLKSTDAKMHYSNAVYMNDPTEGMILLEYLQDGRIEEAFQNGEKFSETSVYLGSFLPAEDINGDTGHEDELLMWRTYGTDENGKEAAGCSIVINSAFFKPPVALEKQMAGDTSNLLLNVIYVKNRQQQNKLLVDENSAIIPALNDFKTELTRLIDLKAGLGEKDLFYIEIDKSIFKRLSRISYLFKSADYEYEHEVRVIKYVARNSDTIKCLPVTAAGKPSRLYIESLNRMVPFINKIYLGPKVENSPYWSLYLDHEIKQREKEQKIPVYVKSLADIQILKSEKKFV